MKKALTAVTFLTIFATPAFAQSFDPDLGSGNIAPLAATNQGGASAYAQAPDGDEIRYSRAQTSRRMHRPEYRSGDHPKMNHNENRSD